MQSHRPLLKLYSWGKPEHLNFLWKFNFIKIYLKCKVTKNCKILYL